MLDSRPSFDAYRPIGELRPTMLTDRQIKHLRTLAHDRKPVVMLGRHGLTEAVLEEIRLALWHHELIKVKIPVGDRDRRDMAVATICEQTGAHLVQRVGHVATLFRRNPEKPRVELP